MSCHRTDRVQDWLDGALAPGEAADFEAHLDGCADCLSEVAAYERVFARIAAAESWDPGPEFTERVLDHVVPARIRRRWLKAFGWGYSGAAAACLAGGLLLAQRPDVRLVVSSLWSAASRGAVQGMVGALNLAGFVVLRLAEGLALIEGAMQWFAPLGRALQTVFGQPAVSVPLAIAVVSCAALLWWMRPRDRRRMEGMRHVGILAF